MPNRKRFITCICLLMVIVGYQTADAQQQLPFGAKARFGMDKGAISDVAFTPDGKTLTTVSRNGTIRFWNTTNGDQRFPTVAHKRVGTVLAFSPDGTILAAVGLCNTIRLWNVTDGKLGSTFVAGHFNVEAIAFSPDDALLASGGWDDLTLWDVRRDRRLRTFREESARIQALTFSPDGQTLVSGNIEGKL